jgi:hypothetical protein
MNVDRALNGLLKLAIALAVIASGAFAVMAVVNGMAQESQNLRNAAERRALVQRSAELNLAAMGSALSCLDAGAGEAVENACEAHVFADPQRAANAVAYTAARLSLLAEAAKDPAPPAGTSSRKSRRRLLPRRRSQPRRKHHSRPACRSRANTIFPRPPRSRRSAS